MNGSDCKDSIDLALDYLEGELTPEVRQRLESHLKDCPPCDAFFESYRKTPEVCRQALSCQMPRTMVSKLLDFLRCESGQKTK